MHAGYSRRNLLCSQLGRKFSMCVYSVAGGGGLRALITSSHSLKLGKDPPAAQDLCQVRRPWACTDENCFWQVVYGSEAAGRAGPGREEFRVRGRSSLWGLARPDMARGNSYISCSSQGHTPAKRRGWERHCGTEWNADLPAPRQEHLMIERHDSSTLGPTHQSLVFRAERALALRGPAAPQ